MKRIRPVTMSQIVGGQTYTYLIIDGSGQMRIEHGRFYGKPRKSCGVWVIRVAKRETDQEKNEDEVLNFELVAGVGLDPQDRYNGSRVFRTNMRNDQILDDLVRRQALDEYLDLIVASTEEREFVAEQGLWNTLAEDQDDEDDWDDFDDEDYEDLSYLFG